MGKGTHSGIPGPRSPRAHLRVALGDAPSSRPDGLGVFCRGVYTPKAASGGPSRWAGPTKYYNNCGGLAARRRLRRFNSKADPCGQAWAAAKAAVHATTAEREATKGRKLAARRAVEGRPALRRFDSADFFCRRGASARGAAEGALSPANARFVKVWPAEFLGPGTPCAPQSKRFHSAVFRYNRNNRYNARDRSVGTRPLVAMAAARSAMHTQRMRDGADDKAEWLTHCRLSSSESESEGERDDDEEQARDGDGESDDELPLPSPPSTPLASSHCAVSPLPAMPRPRWTQSLRVLIPAALTFVDDDAADDGADADSASPPSPPAAAATSPAGAPAAASSSSSRSSWKRDLAIAIPTSTALTPIATPPASCWT